MTTKLTRDQIRKYFETRLSGQKIAASVEVMVRCPFHKDAKPSMSINTEKGVWRCHAGCGGGGLVDFETELSHCDKQTAWANICEIIGIQGTIFAQKPEAIYDYTDAAGTLLFQKLRMPGKKFTQRKPVGKSGWEYKLGDVNKPLYHLPEVVTANVVFVTEGEKDADNLRAIKWEGDALRVTATCNFDGAGKWRDEYAPFFAGKRVVVFADNDKVGKLHAETVAASVARVAYSVKVIGFPELPEHGDVSDFLQVQGVEELKKRIQAAPQWRPAAASDDAVKRLFVGGTEFAVGTKQQQIDWLVDGIIQRGANGFFAAAPKGGKSWAALDLAISVACGIDWLNFPVREPQRVALVSREDNAQLSAWRLGHLFRGKGVCDADLLDRNLYVNTRAQSPELMLDNEEQMAELLSALRTLRPALTIFDVFNVLHAADENDNQEMRRVLQVLTRVQTEIGCAIAVIHHYKKGESGSSMTERLRGSSAISGWAEWLIGITMADETDKTRRMEFELKAACPPEPVHYRISSDGDRTHLEVIDSFDKQRGARPMSKAELLIAGGRQ